MKRLFTTLMVVLLVMAATAQVANSVPNLIGSWSGKLKAGVSSLTLVLHFEQADGYVVCTLDSPDQGAKGIGIYKVFLSADSVSLKVPQIGAAYSAKVDGNRLVGTFSQMGMTFPLTLEKGEYKVPRPQNPQPPYPYRTEEVTFFNSDDNATLAGTLTYPTGYEDMENVPVVVLISGSGLQNRDEEIFDHKPFLVIADHLARNGIASLRYDDRAFAASTGGDRIHSKATTLDYKRDAAAAVGYLRNMGEFASIGAVGHSEGGNIAFMLGAGGSVDFLISMAGVGVRCDVALTAQYNRIAELQGAAEGIDVAQYRKNVAALHSDWMDWFINYDPTADIAAVSCPVLAINGDKDCQVISSLNLPAIKSALPQNALSVVKEYPSLNHLFQHCTTGAPTEYNGIEETISPEVLSNITEWIKRVEK